MKISRLFRVISTCFALFMFPVISFAADSCAENQMMVDGACVEPEFTITTTDMAPGTVFQFNISAAGTYYVDCDNGEDIIKIEKTSTDTEYFFCRYADGGVHTIGMSGDAIMYNGSKAAISFTAHINAHKNIAKLGGSLGAIFGGSAPYMFNGTFANLTALTEIPETLFAGVTGGAGRMFQGTFTNCTSLQSIPETLFAGVTVGAENMFQDTFSN